MHTPARCVLTLAAICAFAPTVRAQGRVNETEPNNTAATANPIAMGDTAYAMIAPDADVDYYAINLAAGTRLSIDIDAVSIGCRVYAHVSLVDGNGTVLEQQDRLSYDDTDFDFQYLIKASGRYFVSVKTAYWTSASDRCYRLKVGQYTLPPEGPGGPPVTVLSGFNSIFGMAAHPSGDMYVIDGGCCGPESQANSRVRRVTPGGNSSVFVSNERLTGGIGVDGFGDLLLTGFDGPVSNQHSVVWRFTPSGQRTVFAEGFSWAYRLVVGPDGDVWVADQSTSELKRFDPLGNLKATVARINAVDLAFSPAGELYVSESEAVWKVVNGTLQHVYEPRHPMGVVGLAFDRDGYLYVGQPGYIDYETGGKLVLLDPQGHIVNDPFALANRRGPHYKTTGFVFTAFLWDGAGNMTNRLWASSGREHDEEIIEMKRAGIRAPGWPDGVNPLALDRSSLRAGIMGAEYADTLRAQNPPGSVTWTLMSGSLPPGVNLTTTTGALRGVPTDVGSFEFAVRAVSGSRLAFARFTVAISTAASLAVDVTPLSTGLVGANYADTLRVTGAPGPMTWSVTSGALPPGITLASGTGVLTGAPSDTGSFSFDARVVSGPSNGSGRFTILVAPVAVSTADVSNALMGVATLTPAVVQYLDHHGNNNGILDVGDLRAFLRAQGQLPASPPRSSP